MGADDSVHCLCDKRNAGEGCRRAHEPVMTHVLVKPLLVGAGVILLLGVGFVAGFNWCNSGKQAAVIDQLEDDKESVADVKEKDRVREKIIYKTKEVIKRVPDTTPCNCLDAPVPLDIDERLFETYLATTRSEAD